MSRRFYRPQTPHTPTRLYRRRLRSARRCALGTALVLILFATLLSVDAPSPWRGAECGTFTGITYIAEAQADSPADAAPRPRLLRPVAPTEQEITPAPPLAFVSSPPLPSDAPLLPPWDAPEPTVLSLLDAEELPALAVAEQTRPRRAEPARTPPSASAAPPAASFAPSGETARLTPPAYRTAPKPPYPPALRARRISGSVAVRIAVSAEGIPTEVTILSPSGHAEFDSTVRRWILDRWRFHPAHSNGKAMAAHVRTRIDFVPNEG